MKDVVYPICGKCHSRNVFLDHDDCGQRAIACLMCGNRYPGNREEFYMSDKAGGQIRKESEGIMEERPGAEKEVRLCSVCNVKPTISDSSPYCASCMGRKGNEQRRQKAVAPPKKDKTKKTKEDTSQAEKASLRPSEAVTIDFSRYPHVLKQVADLAEGEIRPLDLQIIYLLKHHFDTIKPSSKAV